MSIFKKKPGKKEQSKGKQEGSIVSSLRKKVSFEISDDSLIMNSFDFQGQCHCSENGIYILAWRDYTEMGEATGDFLLIENDTLIVRSKLQRPNDGKVSNSGVFVISDWTWREKPNGIIYIIEPDGNEIIQKKFEAHIACNGISVDGRYAACATANSDNLDGNKIYFFDITNERLKWNKELESYPPDSFSFDTKNETLFLEYNDGKRYRYNFDGVFMDSSKWEEDRKDQFSGYDWFYLAEEKQEELDQSDADPSQYNEIISILEKALDKGVSESWESKIHRNLGEIYLKQNSINNAIQQFEIAISINPKIGVRKTLEKLKSEK
jgi:tetratricopeptide (TPR) repeat protein